ncbi:hypothetical protein Lepto7375DRAFT_4603 [Leptolyngbya sp. PCC 7375]|nr:hypothetical protein Lepto7375DRAFT_4603 [Leptolyngbya sp. PCC 7375]
MKNHLSLMLTNVANNVVFSDYEILLNGLKNSLYEGCIHITTTYQDLINL